MIFILGHLSSPAGCLGKWLLNGDRKCWDRKCKCSRSREPWAKLDESVQITPMRCGQVTSFIISKNQSSLSNSSPEALQFLSFAFVSGSASGPRMVEAEYLRSVKSVSRRKMIWVGKRVHKPLPLGRFNFVKPSTELLPLDWLTTTTNWGRMMYSPTLHAKSSVDLFQQIWSGRDLVQEGRIPNLHSTKQDFREQIDKDTSKAEDVLRLGITRA